MRIGVAATPDVAIPSLDWLKDSEHELVRVITQPDRPSGRGQSVKSSSVSDWASTHAIEVVKPDSIEALNSALEGLDLLITIGFGRILPKKSLEIPRLGCINLHFSLLPKYRGAAPVQRAIEMGETQTGVTVFQLDEGMDTGPIYCSRTFTIPSTHRSFELLSDLSVVGALALSQALTEIENGVTPVTQSGQASLAKKLTREEAEIDWRNSCAVIVNKIRAFYPAPTAWTTFREQPLKISKAVLVDTNYGLEAGQLLVADDMCLIGTLDGTICLVSVIPSGKKEMSALDWSRGARFTGTEHCG